MTGTSARSCDAPTFTVPRKAAVEGAIDFPGPIIVEGSLRGDIRCTSLIIMERGVVDGAIVADRVTVLGEASGEIFANWLTLKTACSVSANIFHRQLELEDGAYFEGRSRRHASPLDLAQGMTA